MKNNYLYLLLLGVLMIQPMRAEQRMQIMDHVTFYDGYQVDKIPEDAPDEGVDRLYTYLVTKPLSEEVLNRIGENLKLEVNIFPLCDNYDRIGSVNLAFIPKGASSYEVKYEAGDPFRIEIARFITPFMDKNKEPGMVPYEYNVNYLSNVLRDKKLRAEYDIWLELMVFGVPYAAQKEIAGCEGCQDVFQGSVFLTTDDEPAGSVETNVLIPINIRTADWRSDRGINNYDENCTDERGKTRKTYTFDVPEDVVDGRIVLVMSNHGAGWNGEEYNRRDHYVYFNDEEVMTFKPGRQSCEPFRQYNTQGNGIYGDEEMSDARWQSFSNWCPGDVIDNRLVELGAVKKGTHSVRIEVPKARFMQKDGYFPVSMYFQGDTRLALPPADVAEICVDDYKTSVTLTSTGVTVEAPELINEVVLYSVDGKPIEYGDCSGQMASIKTDGVQPGVYIVAVIAGSIREAHKIAL